MSKLQQDKVLTFFRHSVVSLVLSIDPRYFYSNVH